MERMLPLVEWVADNADRMVGREADSSRAQDRGKVDSSR